MRLSKAMDSYIAVRAQEGFSPHTLNLYKHQLGKLLEDQGDLELCDFTLEHFRNHLSKQTHLKSSSLAAKVRAIKAVFKWFHEEEYLPKNPTLKLKEPKQPNLMPKALTVDEVESLRDSCETLREHALVELFFATGCRLSEIRMLDKADIDFQRGAVTVFGKGSKEREVYFGAKARIWLKRYLKSREDDDPALFVTKYKPHRISGKSIQDEFKAVARRCGLEDKVHPHTMRHTLATTLINQGAPLMVVQSILGHEKPETTLRYSHLSGEARQREYKRYFVQ